MTKSYDVSLLATDATYQLALMLGDTKTTAGQYLFEDEELDWFLTQEGSDVYMAAAVACRAIATSQAKLAVAINVLGGAYQIDRKQVADRYLRLAQDYESKARSVPFSVRKQWADGDESYVKTSLSNHLAFDFEDSEESAA